MNSSRWYCRRCGIVRDTDGAVAPWCRHHALDLPASRMVPIKASHPLTSGSLLWGASDPTLSNERTAAVLRTRSNRDVPTPNLRLPLRVRPQVLPARRHLDWSVRGL